jgi:hypothetical protein
MLRHVAAEDQGIAQSLLAGDQFAQTFLRGRDCLRITLIWTLCRRITAGIGLT